MVVMKRRAQKKRSSLSYLERVYRNFEESGLASTFVRMVETDLHIMAPVDVEDEALRLVSRARLHVEEYIRKVPLFADSLKPLPPDDGAPLIVREMLAAGRISDVGPMAAVAGAIAEAVGRGLRDFGVDDLIVENGGDIFIHRGRKCTVAVFAGTSPLSNKVGITLVPAQMPCGVCCSSGSVGHSLSLGQADAVVVTASSTALADAAATRLGNEVRTKPGSIQRALDVAQEIQGISGVLVIQNEQLGAWGNIELERLSDYKCQGKDKEMPK
jgi:ApbE superfamily uncharacterized protein (UPF0280 family)